MSAPAAPGNPYDGHTLADQLQQVETLTGHKSGFYFVDRGYKGSGVNDIQVILDGQKRGVPESEKRWMRRHNSVEPVIGHLKPDGKMRWCSLKGALGDALNVLLCAFGQNLRKLLRWLHFLPRKCRLLLQSVLSDVLNGLKSGQNQLALSA